MGGRGARSTSGSVTQNKTDSALAGILSLESELQAKHGADFESGIKQAMDLLRDSRLQRVRSRSGLLKISKDLTRVTQEIKHRLDELESLEDNPYQSWPEENTYNWAIAAHGSIENYYRSTDQKHETKDYTKLIQDFHGHRMNREAIQALKRVQLRLKVYSGQWTQKWDALKP